MCPLGSYKFALACADPIVRLYDVRMTGGASTGQNITENDRYKCLTKYCPRSVLETHSKRDNYFSINVTGVDFNELGEIAATYSRVDAYVFSTQPGTHHKELTSETAPNIDSAYYQVQTGMPPLKASGFFFFFSAGFALGSRLRAILQGPQERADIPQGDLVPRW